MSASIYNAVTLALGIGVLIALLVALFSFGAMLFRWKGPRRKGHLIRLLLSLAAIPCLIGFQQAGYGLGTKNPVERSKIVKNERTTL